LRVRLAGRHQRPGHRPHHLRGLIRRQLLRAQRALRADHLEIQRRREDLRLGHDRRPHPLLRRPPPAPPPPPPPVHPPPSPSRSTTAASTRSSATATTST